MDFQFSILEMDEFLEGIMIHLFRKSDGEEKCLRIYLRKRNTEQLIKCECRVEEKPNIPSGMWLKCDKCGSIIYKEDLKANLYVCNSCGNHFKIKSKN